MKVCDISLSGCYLQMSEPLNLGHRVTLLIKVADVEIEANGVVRSSDSTSGMGVGFTYMSAAEHRKLARLVADLEQNLIPRTDNEIETGRGLKAAATRIQRRIVGGLRSGPSPALQNQEKNFPPAHGPAAAEQPRGEPMLIEGDGNRSSQELKLKDFDSRGVQVRRP